MKKLPRIAWEILIFVVLAAVAYGWWAWSDYRWQQRLGETEERLQGEIAEERRQTEGILAERAAAEAGVVGRAFAAGIRDAVAQDRREAVDAAVGELLRIPGIVFAHVLGRDGAVIATSDRKLVATGKAGPRADWALAVRTDSETRPGSTPQSTEVAIPVSDAGNEVVLWIAYEIVTEDAATDAPVPVPEAEAETEVGDDEAEATEAETGAGEDPLI